MRNPVRKFMGVALMAVLGAIALPIATAGAQTIPGEGPAPTPPSCVILSVTPNPVTAFPAEVTVTGTVGADVHLTLFRQTPPGTGALTPIAEQDVLAGAFSISGQLPAESDISVGTTFGNEGAYTGGCATPGGETVVRVRAVEVVRPRPPTAAALAFTGSSDTPSYVLIGIAAIIVGAVLVVAARRRRSIS